MSIEFECEGIVIALGGKLSCGAREAGERVEYREGTRVVPPTGWTTKPYLMCASCYSAYVEHTVLRGHVQFPDPRKDSDNVRARAEEIKEDMRRLVREELGEHDIQ